jgi:hypothetical protein
MPNERTLDSRQNSHAKEMERINSKIERLAKRSEHIFASRPPEPKGSCSPFLFVSVREAEEQASRVVLPASAALAAPPGDRNLKTEAHRRVQAESLMTGSQKSPGSVNGKRSS